MRSETPIRVRYQETDRMGFAHHSAFLVWFEAGRSDLIRAAGRSYAEVEECGLFLPVVEAQARYHRPARYDELLRLRTRVQGWSRAQVRFDYELLRADDATLLATGATRHAVLDERRRPSRIPDWLAEVLRLGLDGPD